MSVEFVADHVLVSKRVFCISKMALNCLRQSGIPGSRWLLHLLCCKTAAVLLARTLNKVVIAKKSVACGVDTFEDQLFLFFLKLKAKSLTSLVELCELNLVVL